MKKIGFWCVDINSGKLKVTLIFGNLEKTANFSKIIFGQNTCPKCEKKSVWFLS